jgi:hypothetical protein
MSRSASLLFDLPRHADRWPSERDLDAPAFHRCAEPVEDIGAPCCQSSPARRTRASPSSPRQWHPSAQTRAPARPHGPIWQCALATSVKPPAPAGPSWRRIQYGSAKRAVSLVAGFLSDGLMGGSRGMGGEMAVLSIAWRFGFYRQPDQLVRAAACRGY